MSQRQLTEAEFVAIGLTMGISPAVSKWLFPQAGKPWGWRKRLREERKALYRPQAELPPLPAEAPPQLKAKVKRQSKPPAVLNTVPSERRRILRRLYDNGATGKEIARALGISPQRVEQLVKAMRLEPIPIYRKRLFYNRFTPWIKETWMQTHYSAGAIAQMLGGPRSWVVDILKQENLWEISRSVLLQPERRCNRCGLIKKDSEYYQSVRYTCKQCWAVYNKQLKKQRRSRQS